MPNALNEISSKDERLTFQKQDLEDDEVGFILLKSSPILVDLREILTKEYKENICDVWNTWHLAHLKFFADAKEDVDVECATTINNLNANDAARDCHAIAKLKLRDDKNITDDKERFEFALQAYSFDGMMSSADCRVPDCRCKRGSLLSSAARSATPSPSPCPRLKLPTTPRSTKTLKNRFIQESDSQIGLKRLRLNFELEDNKLNIQKDHDILDVLHEPANCEFETTKISEDFGDPALCSSQSSNHTNDNIEGSESYSSEQYLYTCNVTNSEDANKSVNCRLDSDTQPLISAPDIVPAHSSDESSKCDETNESLTSAKISENNRRSDASLLLGALLQCETYGHIAISSAKVILHNDQDKSAWTDCQFVNASILVTLSIPHANQGGDVGVHRTKRFNTLPTVSQMVYTMIQSDWSWLDSYEIPLILHRSSTFSLKNADNAEKGLHNKSTLTSLFPRGDTLSLDPIYKRIQDLHFETSIACQNQESQDCHLLLNSDSHTKKLSLAFFSSEIIVQIGGYLQAKSLHALRCTSRTIYTYLNAVVPGLRLQLYPHQCRSLEWMRNREKDVLSVFKSIQLDGVKSQVSSLIRGVTAGMTVSLCMRKTGKSLSLDTSTGRVSPLKIETLKAQGHIARGGLLCDDPGLGKTITVLSLILQTFGQSTESDQVIDLAKYEEAIFRYHWETLHQRERKREMTVIFNRQKGLDKYNIFNHRINLLDPYFENYLEVVEQPMCMDIIAEKLFNSEYEADGVQQEFDSFVADIRMIYENAIKFNPVDSEVYKDAVNLLSEIEKSVLTYKQREMKAARKRAKRGHIDDNLGRLVRREKHAAMTKALVPSQGSLVIVPKTLLKHWQDQMVNHVDFSYCTSKIPLIHHHRFPEKNSSSYLDNHRIFHSMNETETRRNLSSGAYHPIAFIDHGSSEKLPNAAFLAKFHIVLTSQQRLTNEWKNGSVEDVSNRTRYNDGFANEGPVCPLLEVYWLRLIVDEGHTMGRGSRSNAIQFSSWILAQRRWAMTGTPTKQTNRQESLKGLFGLMTFLQHDLFSQRTGGDQTWSRVIGRNFMKGSLDGYFRLEHLLAFFMRRHTKTCVELPRPTFKQTVLSLSSPEILNYNTLVTAIQSNLLLTSMKSETSGMQDSLLHPRQAKYATQALKNLGLACCMAAKLLPSLKEVHRIETLRMLEVEHEADSTMLTVVKNFMHRAITGETSNCGLCGIELQQLVVLPCAHLLCTECLASHKEERECPVCLSIFNPDELQRLQPGFLTEWVPQTSDSVNTNGRQSISRRTHTEHIRDENIEVNDAEDEDSIMIAERHQLHRRRRVNVPHICAFPDKFIDGTCSVCHQIHYGCDMTNDSRTCPVCFRKAEECSSDESKYFYLIQKLWHLKRQQLEIEKRASRTSNAACEFIGHQIFAPRPRPLKVIIFSQFRHNLNLVGDRLVRQFGMGTIAEYNGSLRREELEKFIHETSCFCLLLSNDGSHGLDLSFVTHIILMDEIWDKSLEDQVIARAYRMGSRGSVELEQLIAKDSVEELMTKMKDKKQQALLQDDQSRPSYFRSQNLERDVKQAKLHYLLTNLKMIRPITLGVKRKATKSVLRQSNDKQIKHTVTFA